jgi:hypothetical protein
LVLPDLPDATAWTGAMVSAASKDRPDRKANPARRANPASVDPPDPVERVDLQAAALCW